MARGRMLLKKISLNKAVAALADDTSRMLFTWTIAHLDREGRIHGDPEVLRSIVAPRLAHVTGEVVARCVEEWEKAELVVWYEVDGDRYLAFPKFLDNQRGLHVERESPSDIPEPPDSGVNPAVAGKSPRNVMECNGKKRKGRGLAVTLPGAHGAALDGAAPEPRCGAKEMGELLSKLTRAKGGAE